MRDFLEKEVGLRKVCWGEGQEKKMAAGRKCSFLGTRMDCDMGFAFQTSLGSQRETPDDLNLLLGETGKDFFRILL